MAELMAMMGSTAAGTAAAGTGAGAAAGMLGPAAMGTAEGMLAAGAPTTAELLGGTAFAGDSGLLGLKGLEAAGAGMGGGTANLFGGGEGLEFLKWTQGQEGMNKWQQAAIKDALSRMDNGPVAGPGAMGSRPPGYNPQESMEAQFARIMGWLKENGGKL